MNDLLLITMIILTSLLSACGNYPVTKNELNTVKTIADENALSATILGIRKVQAKSNKEGIAKTIGKTLGSYSGSALGSGALSAAGSMAGGVVGEIIGSGIDEFNSTELAIEILLKTASGKTLLLTQLATEEFKVGDKVSLITLGNKTHIVRRTEVKADNIVKKPKQAIELKQTIEPKQAIEPKPQHTIKPKQRIEPKLQPTIKLEAETIPYIKQYNQRTVEEKKPTKPVINMPIYL